MVKIYKQPFAHGGDAIAIPDASQPDGKMSSADGWTPDYQLPKTDPNYKPVGRQEMNGVFKEVTEALGQIQQFGFADWQNTVGGWPIGASVRHADGYWQSLANGNTEEPGAGVLWKELLFGNLVPASETVRGVIQLATEAQAQELTADDVALTPAKLADALGGANQGLTDNGYQKLPGGLIIQWGLSGSVSDNSSLEVTLPIAFPNAGLQGVCTVISVGGGISSSEVAVPSITNTKITVAFNATTDSVARQIRWLAIGH